MNKWDLSQALSAIQEKRQELFALGQTLFDLPEPGFFEFDTAAQITAFLKRHGIPYRDRIARTGVIATIGEGSFHIALVVDMDALLVNHNGKLVPFHSCGHSIQVAVGLYVLLVLEQTGWFDATGLKFSLFATPAEEFIDLKRRRELMDKGEIQYPSGKQQMIASSLFDDVSCVLSLHVGSSHDAAFDVGGTLSGFCVRQALFQGLTAHSGAFAHEGRNALHAASLCLSALSFLTEQFPHESGIQLHPILTAPATSLNLIPDQISVESYLRAYDFEDLARLQDGFARAAVHCAEALGVKASITATPGYLPLKPNEVLSRMLKNSMQRVSPDSRIVENPVSGASGDIGDLSFLLPCAQFGFSGYSGRIHSDDFIISNPEHAYLDTAMVLVSTIHDLIHTRPIPDGKPAYESNKQWYLKEWLSQSCQDQSN